MIVTAQVIATTQIDPLYLQMATTCTPSNTCESASRSIHVFANTQTTEHQYMRGNSVHRVLCVAVMGNKNERNMLRFLVTVQAINEF